MSNQEDEPAGPTAGPSRLTGRASSPEASILPISPPQETFKSYLDGQQLAIPEFRQEVLSEDGVDQVRVCGGEDYGTSPNASDHQDSPEVPWPRSEDDEHSAQEGSGVYQGTGVDYDDDEIRCLLCRRIFPGLFPMMPTNIAPIAHRRGPPIICEGRLPRVGCDERQLGKRACDDTVSCIAIWCRDCILQVVKDDMRINRLTRCSVCARALLFNDEIRTIVSSADDIGSDDTAFPEIYGQLSWPTAGHFTSAYSTLSKKPVAEGNIAAWSVLNPPVPHISKLDLHRASTENHLYKMMDQMKEGVRVYCSDRRSLQSLVALISMAKMPYTIGGRLVSLTKEIELAILCSAFKRATVARSEHGGFPWNPYPFPAHEIPSEKHVRGLLNRLNQVFQRPSQYNFNAGISPGVLFPPTAPRTPLKKSTSSGNVKKASRRKSRHLRKAVSNADYSTLQTFNESEEEADISADSVRPDRKRIRATGESSPRQQPTPPQTSTARRVKSMPGVSKSKSVAFTKNLGLGRGKGVSQSQHDTPQKKNREGTSSKRNVRVASPQATSPTTPTPIAPATSSRAQPNTHINDEQSTSQSSRKSKRKPVPKVWSPDTWAQN